MAQTMYAHVNKWIKKILKKNLDFLLTRDNYHRAV
jgi:hypothetical protein